MWDFSAGTAIWLMARTLPYLLLRLALYFAVTFAYIVATGTGAAIGYTLGLAGSDDFQAQATIFGGLPDHMPRVVSVGRLDINTEGLLLLTNDGGLARALELPETGWLRRYRVRAYGSITQDKLDALRTGIEIDGVQYGPTVPSTPRRSRVVRAATLLT